MWRLTDEERSTRFELISQYSQLLLQAEQSRKTKGNQGACADRKESATLWRRLEAIQAGN